MTVTDDVSPDVLDGVTLTSFDGADLPDVEPDTAPTYVPDPRDSDPLFSSVTGKTYKTARGKKTAETRWQNRGSVPASSGSMSSRALKSRLQQGYETIGTVVGMLGFVDDGQVIINQAEPCAGAMAEWAESDPRVRAVLEKMLTSSAATKVLVTHGMIAMGIMANHGVNPLAFLGRNTDGS